MRKIPWLILSTSLLAACADQGAPPEPAEASKIPGGSVLDEPLAGIQVIMPAADGRTLAERPNMLARVQRGKSFVEWVGSANAGAGELVTIIGGTAGEAPLIDMTTAESLRPAELFLALAPRETALPDSLLAHASEEDLHLLRDPQALDDLRERVADRIANVHMRFRDELAASAGITPKAGTCTSTEVATARSVYGDGYTPSSTCGDHLGFFSTNRTYYYCNDNGTADCDYPLGTVDGAACDLVNPCDHVKGTVQAVVMRSNTGGNPHFVQTAHRIRGFAMNCEGDSGLEMHIRHGAGGWDSDIAIPVNDYAGAIPHGAGFLPERARAIDFIQDGDWAQGIPASGPDFTGVEYKIISNTGVNDRGIFCTDVQQSLTMSPGNPNSCGHGNVGWCNGACSGGLACFE